MLALLRENEAAVHDALHLYQPALRLAIGYLNTLAPQFGEKKLIKSVATELAKQEALSGNA